MKHLRDDDLRAWLGAEARGDDRAAEEALTRALRRVARPSPAPGFAERVLARTRSEASRDRVPKGVRSFAGLARSIVALALVSLAMLATLVFLVGLTHPVWMDVTFEGFSFSSLTELVVSLLGGAVQSLVNLAAFFTKAYDVALLAGARAARSSTAAVGVIVGFLLAWSAFGALRLLIARERKLGYAST